ncbi:VOC family protein [Chitinilyticum piscinae]|uniref:VOC family protein n=1 Tax=Chitinilyticum piscinae TaxID=2866724 RepID=A0A8J7FR49_9NEIS|nr:VOC family protein [Chitinilyticum piscinae]MBE9609276.1 VOC family protein [Chitinilyticum piscinae]
MHAINWFEIPVLDLDRAIRFYETLFATPLQRTDCGGGMAIFPYQEGGVGGGLVQSDSISPAASGVLPYLNAKDGLDTLLGRLQTLGASITLPKTEISPEIGHIAIFIDSEGNRIGLHQEP